MGSSNNLLLLMFRKLNPISVNSKELEDNIKFTRGLVYCGQTTGVTSMGTRTQNPGVQSSPAWVFMAAPYSITG